MRAADEHWDTGSGRRGEKAPRVTRPKKERWQGGRRKAARPSAVKQRILPFTCRRHADTKTKPTSKALPLASTLEGTADGPGTTREPITVTRDRRTCRFQLFPYSGFTRGTSSRGLHVKGRPRTHMHQSAQRTVFQIRLIISTQTFSAKSPLFFTSSKILGTSFQFFHLSFSSTSWLRAPACQKV